MPNPKSISNRKTKNKYKYAVALSFAGSERDFAEKIASGLKSQGIEVFYDKYEQHELWGKNLHDTLRKVYTKECRYCVIIVSKEYLQRMWPVFERQQIIDRLAIEHGQDFVLPVRLDGCNDEIPGISQGIGYLSVRSNDYRLVIDTLLKKLGQPGYEIDSSEAYDRAMSMIRERIKGYLKYDKIFTSIETLLGSFNGVIGGGDVNIHGWLGHEFYWQRKVDGPLDLFARNQTLERFKKTGLVTICKFKAPKNWIGCGRWAIMYPKYDESEKEEDVTEIIIGLYLYSDNPEDLVKLLENENAAAAFLAALHLEAENTIQFYSLAEERYDRLE